MKAIWNKGPPTPSINEPPSRFVFQASLIDQDISSHGVFRTDVTPNTLLQHLPHAMRRLARSMKRKYQAVSGSGLPGVAKKLKSTNASEHAQPDETTGMTLRSGKVMHRAVDVLEAAPKEVLAKSAGRSADSDDVEESKVIPAASVKDGAPSAVPAGSPSPSDGPDDGGNSGVIPAAIVQEAAPSNVPAGSTSPSDGPEDEEDTGMIPKAQAARAPFLYYFDHESETDYTTGRTQLIVSHDGTKQCPALLLNYKLSQKLQTAVQAERDLFQERERQAEQFSHLTAFRRYAGGEEYRLECEMGRLKRAISSDEVDERAGYARDRDALYEKLEDSNLLEMENRHKLRHAQEAVQQAHLEAAMLMDVVLQDSRLLPVGPKPGIDPDFYEKFRVPDEAKASPAKPSELRSAKSELSYRTFDRSGRGEAYHSRSWRSSPTHSSPPRGPRRHDPATQQASDGVIRDVHREYIDARYRLEQAQIFFDRRAAGVVDDRRRLPTIESETATEYDLWLFQEGGRITRRLIEAEDEYRRIKAEAIAAECSVALDDRSIGFGSMSGDSLGSSAVGNVRIVLPRAKEARIETWMSDIPEEDAAETPARRPSEAWDAKSIDICDSASDVAEGGERRRIDSWRDVCETLRSAL